MNIESLLKEMTLEEKANLCTGATVWTTQAIERLGIPSIVLSDGPHGVRRITDVTNIAGESLPATCFPSASCLSSSWDVDLLRQLGETLGEETVALNVDVSLGPGNNMKRTPLCGRNFEYYSEDPYLAGQLAASHINALQSKGVGASLKHFAVNNQEYQRFRMNAVVDERTLREIYLPAFETAVKQAKPWTIMCAYNKLNGTFCSENHTLLTDILKDEWGFEGVVVSDWGAVHDRVATLRGGLDLEMPGPQDRRVKAVVEAVRSGELPEATLDAAVRRLLTLISKATETPKGGTFDIPAHHALARKIASEGIVLLKNNGLLPLQNPQHIAVIGRSAQKPHFQGGGSSHINPTQVDVPFVEMQKQAGNAELSFADGYPGDDSFQQPMIDQAVSLAQTADVAVLFIALPTFIESEGYDRNDLNLTAQQIALIKAVTSVQPKTIVILNTGSAVAMSDWLDGTAAVLQAGFMGQGGGHALADILFGVVNPSGKLSETYPLTLESTPAYINYPGGNGEVSYGEGLFIGYRYYDAKQVPVLFPFGYGLSYTTFDYNSLKVSAPTFKDVDGLTVSVSVTNTGQRAGKEIVQIYVHDHESKLVRPHKELKGFVKVELQPGETKEVSVHLDFRAFAYYHPGYQQWITEDGDFDILIGASSADIRCVETVKLQSTLVLPCILNRESTVGDWFSYPKGGEILAPVFQQIMAQMGSTFGGGDNPDDLIGMDMQRFMTDMPLLSILEFQAQILPTSPEAMVDQLLDQVRK